MQMNKSYLPVIILLCTLFLFSCALLPASNEPQPTTAPTAIDDQTRRTPRMALWLAKKDELLNHPEAAFDLVMTGWLEMEEAATLRSRAPQAELLAGLSHTWVLDDPGWQTLLLTIANNGNPVGPLQISEDMYLLLDTDADGIPDQRCSPLGWENIHAMDPRHPAWGALIEAFYENLSIQPQHDGAIIDMVDAYPFCEGAWSEGVPSPLDEANWVSAQAELLARIRAKVPQDKWLLANAGHDFPEGSPFPVHLNGYLLENFLGEWGADLEAGLASARRALETTLPPHIVVFAVDTDDTGAVDETRYRVGLAASLLMDNTYFAYDFGSRDHGGVTDWWNPLVDEIILGEALDSYSLIDDLYRRDFTFGTVVIAADGLREITFDAPHREVFSGETASQFQVPAGEAAIFLAEGASPEPGPASSATVQAEGDIFERYPCLPRDNIQAGRVVEIIDGDTIDVEIDGARYRVRYIGMDTPERDEPYYNEATAHNRQLLAGGEIQLIRDVSETDKYDRLLRYILAGGKFVNAELVKNGFAMQVTYPPDVACAETFRASEQAARDAGAGLWAQP